MGEPTEFRGHSRIWLRVMMLATGVPVYVSACLRPGAVPQKSEPTSPAAVQPAPPLATTHAAEPSTPPQANQVLAAAGSADDPRECEDPPSPDEERNKAWSHEVDQLVEAELAKLGHCSTSLTGPGTASAIFRLGFKRDGAPRSQHLVASTLTDCRVANCLKRQLAKLRAPVSRSEHQPSYEVMLELKRGATPRLLDPYTLGATKAQPSAEHDATCRDHAVPGRLDPAHIQQVVRAQYDKFHGCYEAALGRNRKAEGKVAIRFVIGVDGKVAGARVYENTLPDCEAVRCILEGYRGLTFTPPNGEIVTVVYPIMFAPG